MRRAVAALLLLAAAALARPARATVDEFSTFDALAPEQDIKNMFDYYLARPPEAWREEWEDSLGGVRTNEGCMTSGIWYQTNEFKTRAPMGVKSWLDVGFQQRADPAGSWEWLRFDFFRSLGRFGALGGRFQPAYDKSEHNFAAIWQYGNPRQPLFVSGTFTLVDAFNSFWEFRQTVVGGVSTPYRAHPYQPELYVLSHGRSHRIELQGKWLTPSRKSISDPYVPANDGTITLWGSKAYALAEGYLGAWTGIARFEGTQVLSTDRVFAIPGNDRNYRRAWTAEGAVRRRFSPRVRIEGRYLYGNRAENWLPPVASASFHALDRMAAAEVDWEAKPGWQVRTGVLYDRVGVAETGALPGFTWGSRKKSRAFVGLQARFGRVRLQGIEGIDLDKEPYDVTFHHDKGFLHLQTTF